MDHEGPVGGSGIRHLAEGDRFLVAGDFQDHSVALVDAHLGLASSSPGPVTAMPSTSSGCAVLKFIVADIASMEAVIGVGEVGAVGVRSFQCAR